MNIPDWATHTITFRLGGVIKLIAVKEGMYQYLVREDGSPDERATPHKWGLKDWEAALKAAHYKAVVEEVNWSLENE